MKLKKLFPHEIKIAPSLNEGIVVNIGCAGPFVYTSLSAFTTDLQKYLYDPEEHKKILNGFNRPEEVVPPSPQPDTYCVGRSE